MTPKGQHPRNLSGTKTAYAMATLEPSVTEGDAYAAQAGCVATRCSPEGCSYGWTLAHNPGLPADRPVRRPPHRTAAGRAGQDAGRPRPDWSGRAGGAVGARGDPADRATQSASGMVGV